MKTSPNHLPKAVELTLVENARSFVIEALAILNELEAAEGELDERSARMLAGVGVKYGKNSRTPAPATTA
jgi:hypothetical protein